MTVGAKRTVKSLLVLVVGLLLGFLAWQLAKPQAADRAKLVEFNAFQSGFSVSEISEVVDAVAHSNGYSGPITAENVRGAAFEEQLGGYQVPDLSAYHIEPVQLLNAETLAGVSAVYVSTESSVWRTEESPSPMRLLFVDPTSGFAGAQFANGAWKILELQELLSRLDSGTGAVVPFRSRPVLKFTTVGP